MREQQNFTEEELFWMYKAYVDNTTDCGINNNSVISYDEFCKRKINEA